MTGSIKTKTPKFKLIIPQFNIATWHDYIEDNFRAIDALFYNIFDIQKFKGSWNKVTDYKINDVLFIPEDYEVDETGQLKKDDQGELIISEFSGRMVKVLKDHTTDNSDYFSLYYFNHKDEYELFADASTAQKFAQEAKKSELQAQQHVESAANQVQLAKDQVELAKGYADQAKNNATDATEQVELCKEQVQLAKNEVTNAQQEVTNAQEQVQLASNEVDKAKTEVNNAKEQVTLAANQVDLAKQEVVNAKHYADLAAESAILSQKIRVINNVVVPVASWINNSSSNYPQKALINIDNVTEDQIVDVYFAESEAVSGNYSPVTDSVDGGVYIYAKQVPSSNITIPSILIFK